MQVGIIGLGKMGLNFAHNLTEKGIEVIAYDLKYSREDTLNVVVTESVQELISNMSLPRHVILMLPAGSVTNKMILNLSRILDKNDILIDAGNSYYKDSVDNFEKLKEKEIGFIDCGTSGGVDGARHGACLMIGGEKKQFEMVEYIFKNLSIEGGYGHIGSPGSGHFTKMIHNGIEYAMMQGIAEGINIIEKSKFDIDLANITNVWNHGSIIESYLMDITHQIFASDIDLSEISQRIDSSGEGKWTLMEALDLGVATPTISSAMNVRNISSDDTSISNQIVSLMRNKFGGHDFYKEENNE